MDGEGNAHQGASPALGRPASEPARGTDASAVTTPGPRSARASDEERNAVVARLAKATGDGRITLEEFSDAAGAAYAAVTLAELDDLYRSFGLVEALPAPPAGARVASPEAGRVGAAASTDASPQARPAPTGEIAASADSVVAIMSGARRNGRWSVKPRTRAVAFWGGVTLDLRDAVIESDVVEIEAWAVMGAVHITVPEGIPVELSGMVVMGGRTSRVADVSPLPGAPLVRVRARGLWGGVDVRSRRSRRAADPSGANRHPGHRVTEDVGVSRAQHVDQGPGRHRRESRRPDEPGPAGPATSGDLLTVVCTDIVGSTRLAVSLGDQRWHAVLSGHNALVRRLLQRFGGTEVKTSGDGFLLTFTSTRAALQFSMELQEEVAAERSTRPEAPIELRIGVHAGEVERDGTDVIGRNVTIACRLCDAAAPGEVLASSVVADLADSASDLAFGVARNHSLAGIEQPLVARPAVRA